DAGALQRDVDTEFLPWQLLGIADRGHLEAVGSDRDRVALHRDIAREAAMHRIIAKQMRVGLDRAEIVHGDDIDVLAPRFINRAHDIAADAAKSVDGYPEGHGSTLQLACRTGSLPILSPCSTVRAPPWQRLPP